MNIVTWLLANSVYVIFIGWVIPFWKYLKQCMSRLTLSSDIFIGLVLIWAYRKVGKSSLNTFQSSREQVKIVKSFVTLLTVLETYFLLNVLINNIKGLSRFWRVLLESPLFISKPFIIFVFELIKSIHSLVSPHE